MSFAIQKQTAFPIRIINVFLNTRQNRRFSDKKSPNRLDKFMNLSPPKDRDG